MLDAFSPKYQRTISPAALTAPSKQPVGTNRAAFVAGVTCKNRLYLRASANRISLCSIDDAYRAKRTGGACLKPMIGSGGRFATINLMPRESASGA
jgi:hypothetical protein